MDLHGTCDVILKLSCWSTLFLATDVLITNNVSKHQIWFELETAWLVLYSAVLECASSPRVPRVPRVPLFVSCVSLFVFLSLSVFDCL